MCVEEVTEKQKSHSKAVEVGPQPPSVCMAHTRGLVPATCRGDKSHSVNWPFLLQNLVTGTQLWSPGTSRTNSNWFGLSLQVPATCSSKHLSVGGTTPCDQSLRVNSSWRGLVPSSVSTIKLFQLFLFSLANVPLKSRKQVDIKLSKICQNHHNFLTSD